MDEQEPCRTAEQNAKFHAMCRDFAKQMQYGGFMRTETEWKLIFLAAKFQQDVVPNPFGFGFVVVNKARSSGLSMQKFADLLGEMEAFGNTNGIDWTDDEDE